MNYSWTKYGLTFAVLVLGISLSVLIGVTGTGLPGAELFSARSVAERPPSDSHSADVRDELQEPKANARRINSTAGADIAVSAIGLGVAAEGLGAQVKVRLLGVGGQPLVGHRVVATIEYIYRAQSDAGRPDESWTGDTGSDGRLKIPVMAWPLDVRCRMYVSAYGENRGLVTATIDLAHGQSRVLTLTMSETTTCFGRVISALDGRPLPGVLVGVLMGANRRRLPRGVLTDAAGEFELSFIPRVGNILIKFTSELYSTETVDLDLDENGSWITAIWDDTGLNRLAMKTLPVDIEVPLIPARKLIGRVLSPEGEPVSGAEIQVKGYYARSPGAFIPDSVSTRSNRDGEFEIDGIRIDVNYTIDIRADGFAGLQMLIPPFEGVEPIIVDFGAISLGEEVEIRGRITDSAMVPAEGLTVRATLLGERPIHDGTSSIEQSPHRGTPVLMWPKFTAIVDSYGYYSCVGMPAGPYSISVVGDGYRALSAHFNRSLESESSTRLENAVGSIEVNAVLATDEWSLSGKVDMPSSWKAGQVEIFKEPAASGRRVSIDGNGGFVICGLRSSALDEYSLKAIVRTDSGQVVFSGVLKADRVQAGEVLKMLHP